MVDLRTSSVALDIAAARAGAVSPVLAESLQ
jgi:hypothetical protein